MLLRYYSRSYPSPACTVLEDSERVDTEEGRRRLDATVGAIAASATDQQTMDTDIQIRCENRFDWTQGATNGRYPERDCGTQYAVPVMTADVHR